MDAPGSTSRPDPNPSSETVAVPLASPNFTSVVVCGGAEPASKYSTANFSG